MGVHSGAPATLRLEPAEPDSGVVFIRADLPGRPEIKVSPENVIPDSLNRMTVIGNRAKGDGAPTATVGMTEHFLGSCLALGLNNVRAVLDGPECPIFDGSAKNYVDLIREAGLQDQAIPARRFRLKRPVGLIKERAEIIALPAERLRLTFFAEFRHAGMPDEQVTFEPSTEDFTSLIAPARTFCFAEDVERLRQAGLIKGGSLDCAIVLQNGKPIDGGYRLQNELARHKLLDLLGDLAILGRPVSALISARASGHALHYEFIRLLEKELSDE